MLKLIAKSRSRSILLVVITTIRIRCRLAYERSRFVGKSDRSREMITCTNINLTNIYSINITKYSTRSRPRRVRVRARNRGALASHGNPFCGKIAQSTAALTSYTIPRLPEAGQPSRRFFLRGTLVYTSCPSLDPGPRFSKIFDAGSFTHLHIRGLTHILARLKRRPAEPLACYARGGPDESVRFPPSLREVALT